jgi:predicted enzyme related to lactoylglutathione lyase
MKAAATIYVTTLESMAAFYADCFAFDVVDAEPGEYALLDSDSWTLAVVRVPPDVAATISRSVPPARRESTPIKLTFDVPSLEETGARIADLGGRVEGAAWEFNGFRHRDMVDPEGNVGLLREPVAPLPER